MSKKKIFASLITLLLLVVIFYKINFSVLINTFKNFDYKIIPIIAILYILTLYIRGLRWKVLLQNNTKYSIINLAKVFTVGSMLNIYLPARAGDIYRAYYLGKTYDEKKMKIFGTVILERLFDGISVFLLLLTAVLYSYKQPWIINLTYITGTIFILALIFAYVIFKYNKTDIIFDYICRHSTNKVTAIIQKLQSYTNSFIEGFESICDIKKFLILIMLSLFIWGTECYIAYLIVSGFSLGLSFMSGLFIISLTSFSTMIPSTSMFLGPYQYAYILALGIYGIGKSATLAISTVHQGILTIILTAIGLFYLLKFNLKIKDAIK